MNCTLCLLTINFSINSVLAIGGHTLHLKDIPNVFRNSLSSLHVTLMMKRVMMVISSFWSNLDAILLSLSSSVNLMLVEPKRQNWQGNNAVRAMHTRQRKGKPIPITSPPTLKSSLKIVHSTGSNPTFSTIFLHIFGSNITIPRSLYHWGTSVRRRAGSFCQRRNS